MHLKTVAAKGAGGRTRRSEKEEGRAPPAANSRRSLLILLVHRAECARFGDSAGFFMKSEVNMNKLIAKAQVALQSFKKNESGAALVEYSLLIGLITVAVVGTVILVATWISGQWVALEAALP
jgi:pilus assembly protein Flp/PilA